MFRKLVSIAAGASPLKLWLAGGAGFAALAIAAFVGLAFHNLKADRDQLEAFATLACATAGAGFEASIDQVKDAKGKAHQVERRRGELCQARIAHLAKFERDTLAVSNAALGGAIVEHNRKSGVDRTLATRQATAAAAAAANMEKAEHDILQDDRVGDDWFNALERLVGLQPDAA